MTSSPYTPAPVNASVATAADLDAVTETLALAFNQDPVWSWAFPDPERRLEQHRAAWRLLIEAAIDNDWVWLTEGCASAALWVPPGKPELGPEEEERFVALLHEMLGDGAARVIDTFERFEDAHPHRGPHYYLSLLGTHPDHSGQGLGMGLLADNLEHTDAAGVATYLESTNPDNHRRYERLGFVQIGGFELGEDGPGVTQMWRDPR
jgi:GNAT superfamily N-acetyltransferase